jgi:translation initiation factor 3 subunit B
VHAENKSATRANVSFYDMNKEMEVEVKAQRGKNPRKAYTKTEVVQELNLVTTLKDRQCNTLYWSPAGNMIVLASLGESSSGSLEFYDVSAGEVLAVREHYRATEVVWDPSGRTLATCVVQPLAGGYFKFAMDNGYIIWGSQGKQLFQQYDEDTPIIIPSLPSH